MLRIQNITNLVDIYAYHSCLEAPYFFPVEFENWKKSFEQDVDGEGRLLFEKLQGKAAYDDGHIVGYIQYGYTAFGFDEQGEISEKVSYPVIRLFYFNKGREDVGKLLLQEALEEFKDSERVYALFHYFGMSCYARHGKLFETFTWIEDLLHQQGFVTEHENVYYASVIDNCRDSEVTLVVHDLTAGGQKSIDFFGGDRQIGGCEVHNVSKEITYLRWIYVDDSLQNKGLGSLCMAALKQELFQQGIVRLDTDTALNNRRAQHFYEKNDFSRKGLTRSFFFERMCE